MHNKVSPFLANLKTRFKLLTAIRLKRFGLTFASIFGLIWLFLEPAGLFLPEQVNWGWFGYFGLLLFSLIVAAVTNLPSLSISETLSSPSSSIEIKIGNIFDEPGHLVIGANDVFDTEIGEVMKSTSVQGQFLAKIYQGDLDRLDDDIEKALASLDQVRVWEPNKRKGKSWRYPIGTTAVLGSPDKRFFLNAYGYMGNDLRVSSTADALWNSLSSLWEQVRLKGHGLAISIPVVGSNLARTNLPHMTLIKLIIISFIVASKKDFVSERLTVIIHPKDIEWIDFYALEDFLKSICF